MPEKPPVQESDQPEITGPRVSAILVAYNQAPATRRAIEALERSVDRERLEVLVVDCGSRDEGTQLDAENPAIQMLRLPHHLGATRAMNIATRTAKGEFLFFLSPDVAVEPGTVKALADRLEADPEAAAVCPLLVDEGGDPVSRIAHVPNKDELRAACNGRGLPKVDLDLTQESIPVEYPGRDAILVRKQFVRGMNYFDQRYGHYWADADLAVKIRLGMKKIRLYPGIRARFYPAPDPLAGEALARADLVTGAAAFVGKYEGFFSGLTFRLGLALAALGRFDLRLFSAVLSGQKLDGSQAA
jgi:GT2 family glycosyltransferase